MNPFGDISSPQPYHAIARIGRNVVVQRLLKISNKECLCLFSVALVCLSIYLLPALLKKLETD